MGQKNSSVKEAIASGHVDALQAALVPSYQLSIVDLTTAAKAASAPGLLTVLCAFEARHEQRSLFVVDSELDLIGYLATFSQPGTIQPLLHNSVMVVRNPAAAGMLLLGRHYEFTPEVIEALLEVASADEHLLCNRLIHCAADTKYSMRRGTVTQVVERAFRLNEVDGSGLRPLHWACVRGHVEAILVLLQHGADANLGSVAVAVPKLARDFVPGSPVLSMLVCPTLSETDKLMLIRAFVAHGLETDTFTRTFALPPTHRLATEQAVVENLNAYRLFVTAVAADRPQDSVIVPSSPTSIAQTANLLSAAVVGGVRDLAWGRRSIAVRVYAEEQACRSALWNAPVNLTAAHTRVVA